MSRATYANITAAETAVAAEIDSFLTKMDYNGAADHCLAETCGSLDRGLEACLRRFFLGLWFLENSKFHTRATEKTLQDVARICETLLQISGIRPIASKYSHLYSRIYQGLSQWHIGVGNPWAAMWQSNLGQFLSNTSHDMTTEEAMIAADRAYFLGHYLHASTAYFFVEQNATELSTKASACLGRIMSLRLMGEVAEARELISIAQYEYGPIESLTVSLQWQDLLCEIAETGNIKGITSVWDSNSPFHQAKYCIMAALIMYSVKGPFDHSKIRKSRTLRLSFPEEISKGTEEFELCKMLVVLENCYDSRESLIVRLKELGEFLEHTTIRRTTEEYLLLYTAAMRWLSRAKQSQFLAYVLNDYEAISHSLSQGKSADILGLVGDLKEFNEFINTAEDSLAGLPMTSSKRMLKLSSLVVKAGSLYLKNKLPQIVSRKPAAGTSVDNIIVQLAELIIDEIGTVKGPLMKLTQTLVGIKGVPTEARNKLVKALASTRGLDPKLFYEVFKNEQGQAHTEIFRNWQDKPIGVGSMAQVFKAELPDGTPVAVKVIYPKMVQMVKSDLKLLRLLRPCIRYLFDGIDIDGMVSIFERTFIEECDLRQEAKKHQRIYDILKDHPTVTAPRLFPQYTSQSVLVMELVEGQKLHEFAENASASERQNVADAMVDFFFDCITNHRFFPTDPHPGNILVRDGKPVMLDFGNYLEISPTIIKELIPVYRSIFSGDVPGFYRALVDGKIIDPGIISATTFNDQLAPFIIQWWHPQFDPQKHHFSQFFDVYFRNKLQRGLIASSELAVIFVTTFMMFNTIYALLTPAELAASGIRYQDKLGNAV